MSVDGLEQADKTLRVQTAQVEKQVVPNKISLQSHRWQAYSYLWLSVTPKWKFGCCSKFYTFHPNSSISYTSMISAVCGFQVLNDLLQPISYMRGIFREGAFLGKTSQCNTRLGYSHMSPRPYHLQQSGN